MKYTPLTDPDKVVQRLKEEGKIKGESVADGHVGDIYCYELGVHDDIGNRLIWERIGTKRIPGCRCPDCGSEAFETDHPGIAVCGAYPGWFFYYNAEYNAEQEAQGQESGYHHEVVNGELTKVENVESSTSEKEETTV